MKLATYVNYGGKCAEAIAYYEKHLGAKTLAKMTFDQMPEPRQIPPGMEKGILHAAIKIGDTLLMMNDGPGDRVEPMRSAYLSLSVDSDEEAERIYKALSEGGEVFMPMNETFFAHRYAQLRDRFGANWMVIHEKPMGPRP